MQPAYVIREESVLPENELTDLQKRKVGPEALLVVCKACADTCFVPGRVSRTSLLFESPLTGVEYLSLLTLRFISPSFSDLVRTVHRPHIKLC